MKIEVPQEKMISILNEIIEELKEKHLSLGMKATGSWMNSLEATTRVNGGDIYANDYTYYLENGRKDGKRPPISEIEKWVNAKFNKSGKEGLGIAFAVANKIAKDGTKWYKTKSGLLDVLFEKKTIDNFNKRISSLLSVTIQTEMINNIKLLRK